MVSGVIRARMASIPRPGTIEIQITLSFLIRIVTEEPIFSSGVSSCIRPLALNVLNSVLITFTATPGSGAAAVEATGTVSFLQALPKNARVNTRKSAESLFIDFFVTDFFVDQFRSFAGFLGFLPLFHRFFFLT